MALWRAYVRSVISCIWITVASVVVSAALIVTVDTALATTGFNVQDSTLRIPLDVIFQALGFGLTVGAYMVVSGRTTLLDIRHPTRTDWQWTVAGSGALFAIAVTAEVLFVVFNVSTATNVVVEVGSDHPEVLLYLIPLSFIAIGPGEELLFRGAIQGRFDAVFSTPTAITLASAVFAVVHVIAFSGTGLEVVFYKRK